jgi:hypothetical protein
VLHLGGILQQQPFGDFDLQPMRIESSGAQNVEDAFVKALIAEETLTATRGKVVAAA